MQLTLKRKETLSDHEKARLDEVIERCIEQHRHNRQLITHLTLAGVTALTATQARARELQRQGFFIRFWNDLLGRNQDLQARIHFDLAQAQYTSQQLIERFAEQHMLSFELLSTLNNKLNTLCLEIDNELNQVYETLERFFRKTRSELVSIHERLDTLERNVGLLQWSHAIEYHRYEDREYHELSDVEKVICISNDFFRRSGGEWSTGDLMLLKSTLTGLGLDLRGEILPQDFFDAVTQEPQLMQRFFLEISFTQLSKLQVFDAPLLKGLEKIELLRGPESYVIESVKSLLQQHQDLHTEPEILASIVRYYLLKSVDMQTEREVNVFDFVLELLLGLGMLSKGSREAPEEKSEHTLLPEAEQALEDVSELSASNVPPSLKEMDRRMLGVWDFEWHWPYLNYCHGWLEITEKLRESCYAGHLCVDFGNSPRSGETQIYEHAIIYIRERRAHVRCSEASLTEWPLDEFHLNLDPHEDLMAGFSEHANDIHGTIAFKKRISV